MRRDASDDARHRIQLPFQLVVGLLSALLVFLVVAALTISANRGAEIALGSVADETISQSARLLDEKLGRMFEPADNQLRLLAHSGFGQAVTLSQRLERLPVAREVLEGNPLVQAFFIGYRNGDFVLFRSLERQPAESGFDAPAGSALLVQSVTHEFSGEAVGEYLFFGGDGVLLERRAMPDYRFDPRTRPWYAIGIVTADTVLTDPYLFFTTRQVGVTLARRTADGLAVIGLDSEMARLTAELESMLITDSSEVAIVDSDGTVIAHHESDRLLVRDDDEGYRLVHIGELGVSPLSRAHALPGTGSARAHVQEDGRSWQLVRMPLAPIGEMELTALLAIPDDELFAGARAVVEDLLLVALLVFLFSIPVGWWLTRRAVAPLRRLAEGMRAIESFDFSERPIVRSHIDEIDRLSSATGRMRATIANFMQTSVALGAMRETDALLETILRNAVEAVRAREGAIHLLADDGKHMDRVRTCGPGAADALQAWFPSECTRDDGSVTGDAMRTGRTRTRLVADGMLVATPLLTRNAELVGVLSVLLPRESVPDAHRTDPRLGFMEALAASAAVAIETRNFIAQQKHLLESFIELIAAAIDAKSPYTGGHCQRVPELTKMLAAAAERAGDGPFAEFRMTDDEREALHIGAWLHDCGKITTPEHIVDKRTKLECIYDRIHEIRMRFEVLKRDARIDALEAQRAGADAARTQQLLDARLRTLDDAFAFVAECNLGGETMDDARTERLRAIAQWSWTRTLDDCAGVSWEEMARRGECARAALPVEEPLLADAPWHRIPRPESERFGPDNPWGFAMDIPPLKYNQGELYNLSVARGTLTAEDRYIINHHIIQTLIMLSRLPFPRHLANVPEIAGGHHERMDGTGYPRRLRGEDMSVLARAMAIADVFEALTAGDRPYKRPNTLREALTIMAGMVRDRHLDPDLFELFVKSGVYRDYGVRYLESEQIDAVDVESTLALAGHGG